MWEQAHVGFGAQGGSAKVWNETMRLAEARFVQHAPGGGMPSQALKPVKCDQSGRDAPELTICEPPCARHALDRGTLCPPEALLPRNPTWETSHFSGLTT